MVWFGAVCAPCARRLEVDAAKHRPRRAVPARPHGGGVPPRWLRGATAPSNDERAARRCLSVGCPRGCARWFRQRGAPVASGVEPRSAPTGTCTGGGGESGHQGGGETATSCRPAWRRGSRVRSQPFVPPVLDGWAPHPAAPTTPPLVACGYDISLPRCRPLNLVCWQRQVGAPLANAASPPLTAAWGGPMGSLGCPPTREFAPVGRRAHSLTFDPGCVGVGATKGPTEPWPTGGGGSNPLGDVRGRDGGRQEGKHEQGENGRAVLCTRKKTRAGGKTTTRRGTALATKE